MSEKLSLLIKSILHFHKKKNLFKFDTIVKKRLLNKYFEVRHNHFYFRTKKSIIEVYGNNVICIPKLKLPVSKVIIIRKEIVT